MNTRNDGQFRISSEMQDVPPRGNVPTWTLEPELAGPVPRRVVLRLEKIALAALISTVFLFVSIAFLTNDKGWRFTVSVFGWPIYETTNPAWGAVFFAVFFGGFSLLIAIVMELERRRDRSLVQWGTATRGTVVSVERRRRWGLRGSTVTCQQETKIVLAYDTPQGPMKYEVMGEITLNDGKTKVGDTHTLLYSPESPENPKLYKQCLYTAVGADRT
jgi:hypothetical protein